GHLDDHRRGDLTITRSERSGGVEIFSYHAGEASEAAVVCATLVLGAGDGAVSAGVTEGHFRHGLADGGEEAVRYCGVSGEQDQRVAGGGGVRAVDRGYLSRGRR